MITFKNPNDPDNVVIISKIQEWMKTIMNLSESSAVQVMEVDCADPGCAVKETRIILTSGNDFIKNYRIHKPLVYVRKSDVEKLIEKI